MELTIKDKIVLFDDEDEELVQKYRWYLGGVGNLIYAVTANYTPKMYRNVPFRMHQLIMGMPDSEIDHINHDTLDNRRSNLRLCTRQQNSANQRSRGGSSKYKGVSWNCGKWRAVIMIDYRQHSLGRYTNEEDAARAYDRAALKAWGEFAYLNLPELSHGS